LADQEAERALLLAAVSHDLRTPLARLRLSLAMMHRAETDLLESAGRQVDYIEAMLAQFLDFARGFDSETPEEVALMPLLSAAAHTSGIGSQLVIDVPAGLTACVRAVALERAVANLLANAERHGGTPVRLVATRSDDKLLICVEDSGPGFDPADADVLCRPFARGNVARTGGGSGLGLAIIQRIAAAHGGTVSFSRQIGLFRVTIELPQPNYAT
jgi:two-component system osmolarity sensor histidine kinase EnvZ